ATRSGGFALCSHAALARAPQLAAGFRHLVALDPPALPSQDACMRAGGSTGTASFTHLTWGAAELRFAQQIHESEHALRASLVPLYRALREHGTAAGEELERLLRGEGAHGRSATLAARLLGTLAELGLISLDRELAVVTVIEAERTALDRSATFQAARKRYEDGLRWLNGRTPTPTLA
ncbi:MAG: hypothetical protein WBC33_01130, partial [Conexibacter sp.]